MYSKHPVCYVVKEPLKFISRWIAIALCQHPTLTVMALPTCTCDYSVSESKKGKL